MNAINKKGLKEIKQKREHKKWKYEQLKRKIRRKKPFWQQ